MAMQSNGKLAWVTGGSGGIGQAIVDALLEAGWSVLATYASQVPRDVAGAAGAGGEVRSDAGRANSRLRWVHLDVTCEASQQAALGELAGFAAELGHAGLDALVNNAGVVVSGPMECVPVEDLRRQLEINVLGVMRTTQLALPRLRVSLGRVVNMSSVSGRVAAPFLGPYAMSKFAMEAMSDALRVELRRQGVGVTVIEPGPIQSGIWDKASEDAAERFAKAPQELHEVYREQMEAISELSRQAASKADPASWVATAVMQAITAKRAPARIPVGRGVRAMLLALRFLPDFWRDGMIERQMAKFSR